MRQALAVGTAGALMVWAGLVLAASMLLGPLLAVAAGLVVGGAAALLLAEFLAPKRTGRRR